MVVLIKCSLGNFESLECGQNYQNLSFANCSQYGQLKIQNLWIMTQHRKKQMKFGPLWYMYVRNAQRVFLTLNMLSRSEVTQCSCRKIAL